MMHETILLQHPAESRLESNGVGGYALFVPGSIGVGLDAPLARLWQAAAGLTLAELTDQFGDAYPDLLAEVQALRVAGLLLPPLVQAPASVPLPDPAPLVSVIIVTRDGRHHLQECLPSIQAQSYPHIELIIVDDASTDDTVDYLQSQFPQAQVVEQKNGPNFAVGCNLGARQAKGDLLFFLNNDTVLALDCIQELVAVQEGQPNVGGVAAMMRLYNNRPFINGMGTILRRFGFGYDLGFGSLDVGQYKDVQEVPLLCFGAVLIPRPAWQQIGPLTDQFQFYYEDADWSYRARAQGLTLLAASRALVYHKFSASMGQLPSTFKLRLVTRNRLWFALKNLPVLEMLAQLGFYWLDDFLRTWQMALKGEWLLLLAVSQAWMQFFNGLPAMAAARRQRRQTNPVNLTELARPFPLPLPIHTIPYLTQELIAQQYKSALLRYDTGWVRQRLLIISPDAINVNMGGVGIRYWELAGQLSSVAEVVLAVPSETDLSDERFTICSYQEGDEGSLRPLVEMVDTLLLSGFTIFHHPFLRRTTQYKIIDLYDPMILENLERFAARPLAEREGLHQVGVVTFNELFALGDFFICASEKQRDYWLGALSSANRVNPAVYMDDPTLRRLIDVVPFGLPDESPQAAKRVLKGVWPGIGPEDKVILWGGGLWDWLDPLTLIEAMPTVLAQFPEARLFFLGTKHPNPEVPPSQMAQRTIERAEEIGLRGTAVFFNDWTPYQERVNYLVESDVGVSLHGDHIETRFAVRTRLMDYLWANLPMVVGGGDVLSDLVQAHGLGQVVNAGDVTAVAQSLVDLLQNPIESERFSPVVAQFHWSRVAEPLCQYVQRPWRNKGGGGAGTAVVLKPPTTPLQQLPGKGLASLKQRGLTGLGKDVVNYLRWLQNN